MSMFLGKYIILDLDLRRENQFVYITTWQARFPYLLMMWLVKFLFYFCLNDCTILASGWLILLESI